MGCTRAVGANHRAAPPRRGGSEGWSTGNVSKELSCRMSQRKEEGLGVLQALKDTSSIQGMKRIQVLGWTNKPDLGKAL